MVYVPGMLKSEPEAVAVVVGGGEVKVKFVGLLDPLTSSGDIATYGFLQVMPIFGVSEAE
jgi:hypothetical protein